MNCSSYKKVIFFTLLSSGISLEGSDSTKARPSQERALALPITSGALSSDEKKQTVDLASLDNNFELYYLLSRRILTAHNLTKQDIEKIFAIPYSDPKMSLALLLMFGVQVDSEEAQAITPLLFCNPGPWSIDEPLLPGLKLALSLLFMEAIFWKKFNLADEFLALGADPQEKTIIVNTDTKEKIEERVKVEGATYPIWVEGYTWDYEENKQRRHYILSKANLNSIFGELRETLLHRLVRGSEKIEEIALLLDYGAHPSSVDKNGNTPLHLACDSRSNGNLELVLLLTRGIYELPNL